MRTTAEECARIGADIAGKLAKAKGPVSVLLPAGGVSAIDRAGQPFDDPAARQALFDTIRKGAPHLDVRELEFHINDPKFATALAERLLAMLHARAE
jgi:uncharacterized protein (UPF0261 family)